MQTKKSKNYQTSFLYPDLMDQLDQKDPLLKLSREIPWEYFEKEFSSLYSANGRPAHSVRLMTGLLLLKQLEDLSDEAVVVKWKQNPYFQAFCGEREFRLTAPCDASDLVYFRRRIGKEGFEKIFSMSVRLHGSSAEEKIVNIDTTVQEKNITYPTDAKLAIKMINRCLKLAKDHQIKLRRTYVKEVKALRITLRFFRHPKKRKFAKKSMRRLKTIAGKLIRELTRKLPKDQLKHELDNFALYQKVLSQKRSSKNKIYSLHEPHVYCLAKGKDHKAYEYGTKVSIAATVKSKVIVAAVNHEVNQHDSKTLESVFKQMNSIRKSPPEQASCDRGYRGVSQVGRTKIIIPKPPLKRDTQYQKNKKRKICRGRAGIEPIIGHLKSDFRLSRNFLKGKAGDTINVLMAACAWNLKLLLRQFIFFLFFFFLYQKILEKLKYIIKNFKQNFQINKNFYVIAN
jgi:transposase, IS5 family